MACRMLAAFTVVALGCVLACGSVKSPAPAGDVDADTDTDADGDTDTDSDADSDADTDSDSDSTTDTSSGSDTGTGSDSDSAPPCGGWVSPDLPGCWYLGAPSASCNTVCVSHGGFDAAMSQHEGAVVGRHFCDGCAGWGAVGSIEVVMPWTACDGGGGAAVTAADGNLPGGDYTAEAWCGQLVCSCFE